MNQAPAPAQPARPLLELARPLFSCLARLRREAARGAAPGHQEAKREIETVLGTLRDRAAADARLAAQYARIEAVLVFFTDFMIKEGPFPFAREWQELAFSIGEGAGDEKFFELLDQCLADPGAEAVERLWVFHECMALGFDGVHAALGERKLVQRRLKVLALRLGLDQSRDGFPLDEPPPAPAVAGFRHPAAGARSLALVLLGVAALVAMANVIAYYQVTRDLRDALSRSLDRAGADLAPAGSARPSEER